MINWLRVKQALRDWLRIRGDYDRFADSYALTAAARDRGLIEAVRYRQTTDQGILVLAHFPQTFERLQTLFEEQDISYEVGPLRLTPEFLLEQHPATRPAARPVVLTLVPTLDDAALDRPLPVRKRFKLSMMVVERHPRLAEERRVEMFARICPCPVRLGYLLSFEDPVIRHCIPPNTVQILQQFGLRDQQLVTSRMVSNLVDRVLKRIAVAEAPRSSEGSAAQPQLLSAEDWLKRLTAPPQD